ncbi:MAG: DUF3427 domain-containing protein [Acholeplasmatales bacterium]|nr:MAG: DUF3427 domain-containing protein [Acholeplasmatales bacterium]
MFVPEVDVAMGLVSNQSKPSFFHELTTSLMHCERFYFSVAFINYSGLQLLLDALKAVENTSIKGQIITSTYLHFTDVKSLQKLNALKHIDTRIYPASNHQGFHTKGYIFEYTDYYKVIIGSANLTQSALKTNVEWNVRYVSKGKTDHFTVAVLKAFDDLWNMTAPLNDHFIEQYTAFLSTIKHYVEQEHDAFTYQLEVKPNQMQLDGLESLDALRQNAQDKALIIAATGTGKTFLSAFDVLQFDAKKVLFLVHREVILNGAIEAFSRVHPDKVLVKIQGSGPIAEGDFYFAMIPSLYQNKLYQTLPRDAFDYMIADEAHRAYSPSYRTLLEYFTPGFLLGMTATPERSDGGNIFALFNHTIALEIRLRDALEHALVIPFHYFGITDVISEALDLDHTPIDVIAEKLSIKARVDFVIEKMLHYGFSGEKRQCLAFCANIEHARYMADSFNAFGFPARALTGQDDDATRMATIARLQDLSDPLECVFTVDIFNEGVDIPAINLVMMLRPTQSPIIFTQQLGRGLRKHVDKDFLTVLDFIGNHQKAFLISLALTGTPYFDKDTLKVNVVNDFDDIPGCTHIQLDEIAKERILQQLESVNFNHMPYLKKAYQAFKQDLGGRIPNLVDYALHEQAPDPIRFIESAHSYRAFIERVEDDRVLTLTQKHRDTLRSLDKQLPIKRLNEFVVIRYLIEHGTIDAATAQHALLKIMTDIDAASLHHTFQYLSGQILGPSEPDLFPYITGNGKDQLRLNDVTLLQDRTVLDTLNYGILRYQKEFGHAPLPYPYLKRYQRYKMRELGWLTNYDKSFASIRGSGVWRYGAHIYLFVDLHKGDAVPEHLQYRDQLMSPTRMRWQSQNKTSQDSPLGQALCAHENRGITLHMFIRKAKVIAGQKLDYVYIGPVACHDYHGNQPITFTFRILHPLPNALYRDLTQVLETHSQKAHVLNSD